MEDAEQKRQTTTEKQFVVTETSPLSQASFTCNKHNFKLPEIHNIEDYRALEDLMRGSSIQQAIAGIKYNKIGNRIVYSSDESPINKNIFGTIYYGGAYTGSWHSAQDWEGNAWLKHEMQNYPIVYTISNSGIKLGVLDKDRLHSNVTIVCEKSNIDQGIATEKVIFMKIVTHACLSDGPSVISETEQAINDIKLITNLRFNTLLPDETKETDRLQNYIPHLTRTKRDLGFLGSASVFGTIVGGTTYVLKSILDTIFGASTYAKRSDVVKIAHEMETLRINQHHLQMVVKQMTLTMNTFETKINNLIEGIILLNYESELKNLNRRLQSILTFTLLKYSAALIAAKDGKPHPYALSQIEVENLATTYFSTHNVHLDKHIDNVKASFLFTNDSLCFFFDIPIIHNDKTFNFYNIVPIPTFADS
ncbi:MAG: hypothetical protein FJ333_10970, partial [Sphingomonadales bacterium]|nr:hypothetical protein [Sphingomonadales bacterium]